MLPFSGRDSTSYTYNNGLQLIDFTPSSIATSGPTKIGASGTGCYDWTQEIQVIDRSGGSAVKRGKIALPDNSGYWYSGWGWYGCYACDWYNGGDIVQVQGDALAFRRWIPRYNSNGTYFDSQTALYVVDLSKPVQPALASLTTAELQNGWWGNMRANADKLYACHYEWQRYPTYDSWNEALLRCVGGLSGNGLSVQPRPHVVRGPGTGARGGAGLGR